MQKYYPYSVLLKNMKNYEIIDKLYAYHNADRAEFTALINTVTDKELEYLRKRHSRRHKNTTVTRCIFVA